MAIAPTAPPPRRQGSDAGKDRRPAAHAEQLIRRWRQTGDDRYRSRAIEAYMPLARRLAHRYHPGPEPFDDLLQVACIGLVKAVDRFDPDAGPRFGSFAIPTITGELRRHFRDTTWAVHVPRGAQENMLRVRQATDALSERNGRAPTVGELCEETGLDAEQIADALQARSAKETTSFDGPTYGREDDVPTLGETLGRDDAGFELVEDRVTVAPLLRSLPRRDREMLFMRFARDMTQSEIAERLGCSQMHVSRLLRDALDRLAERTDRQLAERV